MRLAHCDSSRRSGVRTKGEAAAAASQKEEEDAPSVVRVVSEAMCREMFSTTELKTRKAVRGDGVMLLHDPSFVSSPRPAAAALRKGGDSPTEEGPPVAPQHHHHPKSNANGIFLVHALGRGGGEAATAAGARAAALPPTTTEEEEEEGEEEEDDGSAKRVARTVRRSDGDGNKSGIPLYNSWRFKKCRTHAIW